MTSTALVALLALHLAAAAPSTALPADYHKLKAQAERQHGQGAYQQALELYQKAAALGLSPADRRWVEFRLADAGWRSPAATSRLCRRSSKGTCRMNRRRRIWMRSSPWATAHGWRRMRLTG